MDGLGRILGNERSWQGAVEGGCWQEWWKFRIFVGGVGREDVGKEGLVRSVGKRVLM